MSEKANLQFWNGFRFQFQLQLLKDFIFSQIQNNTFFEINNSSGIIKTKAELDFETQKMHEVVSLKSLPLVVDRLRDLT